MNIEEVREYTLSLPGVTEDQPFGDDIITFRLEGKIFVCLWLGGGEHDMEDSEPRLALKLSPERNEELRGQFAAVTPAWHWNKKHWSDVYYEQIEDALVKEWIRESYLLIASKLPKVIKQKYTMSFKNLFKVLTVLLLFALCVPQTVYGRYAAYLMVYFKEHGHNVYFAVSRDGRTFTDVNGGEPVMTGDTLAEQKGIRDPHLMRGPNGAFYLAMTDLHIYAKQEGLRDTEWEREGYGWGNNRAIVLMKSEDLIHWKRANVRLDKVFPDFGDIGCVWAPATIYDEEAGKLMLSFTMRYGADGLHKLYYSYVNDDYDTLLTPPRQLFEYPKACSCIDSDITHVGNKYHLYYVAHDSDDSGVKHAVSDHATGPYTYEPQWCDPERTACEAPTLWQMIGRNEWILMYDVFSARPNNMGFSSTTDFVRYTDLGHFNQGEMKTTNFSSPKHGAVIQITKKELRRLQKQWNFKL